MHALDSVLDEDIVQELGVVRHAVVVALSDGNLPSTTWRPNSHTASIHTEIKGQVVSRDPTFLKTIVHPARIDIYTSCGLVGRGNACEREGFFASSGLMTARSSSESERSWCVRIAGPFSLLRDERRLPSVMGSTEDLV